ncbi:MAG: hypothetical protein ACE5G8_01155 [Anaerolineae bacterium]
MPRPPFDTLLPLLYNTSLGADMIYHDPALNKTTNRSYQSSIVADALP